MNVKDHSDFKGNILFQGLLRVLRGAVELCGDISVHTKLTWKSEVGVINTETTFSFCIGF